MTELKSRSCRDRKPGPFSPLTPGLWPEAAKTSLCEAHSPPHLACRKAKVRNAQATRDASRWQPPLMEPTHGGVSTHTQGGEQLKTPWSSLEATPMKSFKKKKKTSTSFLLFPARYVCDDSPRRNHQKSKSLQDLRYPISGIPRAALSARIHEKNSAGAVLSEIPTTVFIM